MEQQDVTEEPAPRLYSPLWLGAHFILGGPGLGLLTYGLNVLRRGQRVLGWIFCSLGGAVLALVVVVVLAGKRVTGIGIGGVMFGAVVVAIERRPYEVAVEHGALPARGWIPLVLFWGAALVVVIGAALLLLEPGMSGAP